MQLPGLYDTPFEYCDSDDTVKDSNYSPELQSESDSSDAEDDRRVGGSYDSSECTAPLHLNAGEYINIFYKMIY